MLRQRTGACSATSASVLFYLEPLLDSRSLIYLFSCESVREHPRQLHVQSETFCLSEILWMMLLYSPPTLQDNAIRSTRKTLLDAEQKENDSSSSLLFTIVETRKRKSRLPLYVAVRAQLLCASFHSV